jgi:hypothetical protein
VVSRHQTDRSNRMELSGSMPNQLDLACIRTELS